LEKKFGWQEGRGGPGRKYGKGESQRNSERAWRGGKEIGRGNNPENLIYMAVDCLKKRRNAAGSRGHKGGGGGRGRRDERRSYKIKNYFP